MDSDRLEAMLVDIVNETKEVSPATPQEAEVPAMWLCLLAITGSSKS